MFHLHSFREGAIDAIKRVPDLIISCQVRSAFGVASDYG